MSLMWLLGSLTSFADAGIQISAPSEYSAPKYWCGTNCRIYVSALANGGDSIGSVRLSLEDEESSREIFSESYISPFRVQRDAAFMFDSTEFMSGSTVTVVYEAWTLYGVHYVGKYSAPVMNNAVVAELTEFTQGDYDQRGKMVMWQGLGMANYGFPTIFQSSWSSYDYLAALAGCNFAYIHTHSLDTYEMWSDYYWDNPEPDINGSWWQSWNKARKIRPTAPPSDQNGLIERRAIHIGTDVPPINSTGLPPIQIAWNDCCLTGLVNDFAEGYLLPYTNEYTQPFECENQAQLAWIISKQSNATVTCVNEFLDWMLASYCIETARDAVYYAYEDWCDQNGVALMIVAPEQALHVWGDFATKLKGVYTGDPLDDYYQLPVSDWYREIEY